MDRLFRENGEQCFCRYNATHGMAHQDGPHRGVDCGRGRRVGHLEIDDLVLEPFLESPYTLVQVASCLKLGIRDCEDGDLGQGMLEQRLHVARKRSERLIPALLLDLSVNVFSAQFHCLQTA